MAPDFDPYYKWLAIPPEDQPPNYYRLLGLRLFESDPEVIEAAADQRMAHLRTYQTGPYAALSQKLLNEVAGAKICLLSAEKRARYNETLRAALPPAVPPVLAAVPPPVVPPPPPVRRQPAADAATIAGGFRSGPPGAPVAPPPSTTSTPPLPIPPSGPVAQAPGDAPFDFERWEVSEPSGKKPAAPLADATERRSPTPVDRRIVATSEKTVPAAEKKVKRGRKRSIGLLFMFAILLGSIAAAVYLSKAWRIGEIGTAVDAKSAGPTGSATADPAVSQSRPAVGSSRAAQNDSVRKPPSLVQPANKATLPNPNPPVGILLQWQPVANASRYWVRVEIPQYKKPLVDAQDLAVTSVRIKLPRPVPPENCSAWQWRIRALVNGQWTDWSEVRTFDLAAPPPQTARMPMLEENPQIQLQPVGPQKASEPEKPVETPRPIVRKPLPPEAARKQATQVIREFYKKQYDAAARKPADRLALADDMMQKAEESANDPAAQYVLMDRARVLSANAGDPAKALEIVERMGQYFLIDVLPLKTESLTESLQPGVPPIAQDPSIGESVLEVMDQLGRTGQYETGLQLGNLYRERAPRPIDPNFLRRLMAEIRKIREGMQKSAKHGKE